MGEGKKIVTLSARDRKSLEGLVDRPGISLKLIIRAWIILLSASGHSTGNIASRLGVSNSTVLYWRTRFLRGGINEVAEEKQISRPRHRAEEIRKIVEATMKEFPKRARRWSIRNMARFMGVSRSTVQRIWKKYGLKPQNEDFKFKHNPQFYEDCKDIAGLYLESHRVYAIALLTENTSGPIFGKSTTQADSQSVEENILLKLLRTIRRNEAGRSPKHGFLEYLKWTNNHTPPETIIHLIVPRESLSIYPPIFRWLKRHPRFQQHIIPKNISDRRFLPEWYARTCDAAKTNKTFPNLPDLQTGLAEFLSEIARPPASLKKLTLPKPFVWVRPDRNYLMDKNQLELNLLSA